MAKFYLRCSLALILLLGAVQASGQNINVEGIVTDGDGNALAGATVVVQGTARGATTNAEGRYTLAVYSEADVLRFSYVGHLSQSVQVGAKRTINIVMLPDVRSIDQVIVTGYQTISKERATGAFSKLTAEDWENKRPTSVNNLIEGSVAGFNNGLIRGTTTFFAGTSPLYVIDGFPVETANYNSGGTLQETLPDLNIEDIESITVLKDAAATSIYGARAANGVIVIVTKKAKTDQTNISFSTTFAVRPYDYYTGNIADASTIIGIEREIVTKNTDLANPATAQNYLDKAVYTSAGMKALLNFAAGNISEVAMNDILNSLAGNGHSYLNDVEQYGKRNKFSQQYNVNVSYGTQRSSTYVSFTYVNDKLEDKFTNNESFGGSVKTTMQLRDWISVDFGTFFNYGKGTLQSFSLTAYPLPYAYSIYDRLVNEDGTPRTILASDRLSVDTNNILTSYGLNSQDLTSLDELGRNVGKSRDFLNRSYGRLNLIFTDYLRYSISFQYEYGHNQYSRLDEKDSYTVRALVNRFATGTGGVATFNLPNGNIFNKTMSTTNSYNFRQQLDFDKTFLGVHNVTALAGFEVRHFRAEFDGTTRYNYDPQMLSFSPINQPQLINGITGLLGYASIQSDAIRELVNRYVSIYGNIAYNFDRRYTVTGSLRWDRSNLWGTSNTYQDKPTWSVGAAWNASNEGFFNVPWVNSLKTRISYGTGGNIGRDSSPYLTVSFYNNTNVGGRYAQINGQPNPLLSWERTATFNLGVDFGLWDNRLTGSIDWYRKRGTNLLANTMGNPTEGFGVSTIQINNGAMTNNGIEFLLAGRIMQRGDFSWNAQAVYAYNKNKVTEVTGEAPVYYIFLDYSSAYPRIGNPYQSLYGYKWGGLTTDGIPQVYDSAGQLTSQQPGDLASIVYLGSLVPTSNGSLSMDFRYKNLSFSFMMLFDAGHKVRDNFLPVLPRQYSSAAGGYIPFTTGSINDRIVNRWQQPGDEAKTDIPRLLINRSDFTLYNESIYTYASIHALNASNLRMRTMSLNYRLSNEIAQKLYMQNARVQFTVEDLFMIAASKEAKYRLNGFIKPTYVWSLYFNF